MKKKSGKTLMQKWKNKIGGKLSALDKKKLVLTNIPYALAAFYADRAFFLYRNSPGEDMGNKLLYAMEHADRIFAGFVLSNNWKDLLAGIVVAVVLKVLVWQKQAEAKKLRKGIQNYYQLATCKELNISNIGRNDSFYLVGGDSLLIAQVIGKMLEKIPEAEGWEWSALLTEMMQTPTIKGIAEKIEAFQKDTDYVIDPCLVQLKKSVKENSQSVAKVLFHAGTGTLTPYNALLSYIEKDSKENEAIIGFTFGDDADYISMETSQTFRLLGEKYGKILNKLGYSNYILIGHCVGGLIALETAQYLQKKNVQVSDVTLISSNIPKQKNQTILSQATDEIYRKTLQSSLDNEILLERIFAKLIGADAYKAGYQVDEERLQQYIEYIVDQGTGDITVEALCNTGGKFEDVAKEFRLLASKSVSERLNALYNIIERPNGELMEHQLKMLNILFRVFSQNFRCVSTYEPKPYYGNMRILCCEIQGGHFYPGFFAEDYETWKPYAKGNLTFDLIKGWHLDCITEPNLGENIKKMLDFNY